jgi:putative FmdB family regulatory protein
MPIYEYQCEKCHHHLEALQKLSDKPLRECPECGKHSLKRLLSAPLFRLAGSGWYETDFKSDKETKRNLAGKDEAPSEGSKETAAKGAETKPDKPDKGDKPDKVDKVDKVEKKPTVTRSASRAHRSRTVSKPAVKKTVAKKASKKR